MKTLCAFGDRPLGPWYLGMWCSIPHRLSGHLVLALVATLTLVASHPAHLTLATLGLLQTRLSNLAGPWCSFTLWPHQYPSALVIPHSHYCLLVEGSDTF